MIKLLKTTTSDIILCLFDCRRSLRIIFSGLMIKILEIYLDHLRCFQVSLIASLL